MAEGRNNWPKVDDDWFVEPPAATHFLLEREEFRGSTWDPACGQGNIVRACTMLNVDCYGSDLRRRAMGDMALRFLGEIDYLAQDPAGTPRADNIICNPPYGRAKLAEAFIRHALRWPRLRKAAFFVTQKFLFGSARGRGLYLEFPPDRIYPVRPRPSCPPGVFLLAGGEAKGGVENFCWLVWDRAAPTGRTEFIWR